MRSNPIALTALLMLVSTATVNAADAPKVDPAAVNAACETDASTAGCTGKTVGTGLLKCIADYKKAHPEFKYSESCKATVAQEYKDYKATQPPPAAPQ